jgi:hypothetical protein
MGAPSAFGVSCSWFEHRPVVRAARASRQRVAAMSTARSKVSSIRSLSFGRTGFVPTKTGFYVYLNKLSLTQANRSETHQQN